MQADYPERPAHITPGEDIKSGMERSTTVPRLDKQPQTGNSAEPQPGQIQYKVQRLHCEYVSNASCHLELR
ncbi:hypothetical protein G3I59_36720 [Amycolatopsis rubida]|uniref:Uncharacterized protein n=1 Tax=Amycolatopsis rubida TaxID=112413 RepID=A0ABX0BZH8_9PSEU|nr:MULTISPECIES: hypothetical protein [Amycolatopsis]MYW96003.1 hypothetical protein [Amycolatopsis rubida]NEC60994.1 hypothetical protein [Amycolatopsis rubida]